MKLSDTAAAYGLFQVVFADLTDHLAQATYDLRAQREPGLGFETVFRQRFSRALEQFRCELQQFDQRSPDSESLDALREAAAIIPKVEKWRNERIHARVHLTEHGYVLRDWRTGRLLEITTEQVELQINLAIKAMVLFEAHVPRLVNLVTWNAENERLFSMLPELSEAPDHT